MNKPNVTTNSGNHKPLSSRSQQKRLRKQLRKAGRKAATAESNPKNRKSIYALEGHPNGEGTYRITETDLVTGRMAVIPRCSQKAAFQLLVASKMMIEGGAR